MQISEQTIETSNNTNFFEKCSQTFQFIIVFHLNVILQNSNIFVTWFEYTFFNCLFIFANIAYD